MYVESYQVDVPKPFSDYGLLSIEELPVLDVVLEGSELIVAGHCDMTIGRFVDVYNVDGDIEYKVINDNRG